MSEIIYIGDVFNSGTDTPCVFVDVTISVDGEDSQRRFALPYVEVEGRKYIFFLSDGYGFHHIQKNPEITFEFSSSQITPSNTLSKRGICLVVNQFRYIFFSEIRKEFRKIYSSISFSDTTEYLWCELIETNIELFKSGEKYDLVPRPKNFVEFSEVLQWYTPILVNNYAVYWRGMSNIQWDMDSTLGRKMKPRFKEIEDEERRLLQDARQEGYGYHNGRALSDLELLSVLQHYGAATRLIDFTEDPFVALWFATREKAYEGQDGVLILAIPDHGYQSHNGETHTPYMYVDEPQKATASLDEIIPSNTSRQKEEYFFWKPTKLFGRMSIQKSVFFFGRHLDPHTSLNDIGWEHWGPHVFRPIYFNSTDDLHVSPVHFRAIAISPELKRDMQAKWEPLFGFNARTLFPDLSGFAQHWSYTPSHTSDKPLD